MTSRGRGIALAAVLGGFAPAMAADHRVTSGFSCSGTTTEGCFCNTPLKFTAASGDYYAGSCEDKGLNGTTIVWLCFDQDDDGGNNQCTHAFRGQPLRMGHLAPEDVKAKKLPYNDLVIQSLTKETGPDNAQLAVATMKLTKPAEPSKTLVMKFRFTETPRVMFLATPETEALVHALDPDVINK